MLDFIIERTNKYIDDMPKKERKKYGQFFTSKETARFMAELYTIPENLSKVRILDSGAGSGILSCALLERLEQMDSIQMIELTCYENDDNILGLLKENLYICQANSKKDIQIHIITDNYITSQYLDFNHMLGGNPDPKKYDFVIGNPPYMKILKMRRKQQLCRMYVMAHPIYISFLLQWDYSILMSMANWCILSPAHGLPGLILSDLDSIF